MGVPYRFQLELVNETGLKLQPLPLGRCTCSIYIVPEKPTSSNSHHLLFKWPSNSGPDFRGKCAH